ncbi:MAG: ATP-dependent DNA helicase RecG [Candidatus Dojkabacteria bacterium]
MNYQLSDKVTVLPGISERYAASFERIGIFTVKDLLTYFPYKYLDTDQKKTIQEILLNPDEEVKYLVQVRIKDFKNQYIRGGRSIQNGLIYDESGEMKVSWFNQPFMARVLAKDSEFLFYGKIKVKGKHTIMHPTIFEEVKEDKEAIHLSRLTPEYRLTSGISKKWLRTKIKFLCDFLDIIDITDEFLKEGLSKDSNKNLIKDVHFPESAKNLDAAVKELSLREFTDIQLKLEEKRSKMKKLKAIPGKKTVDIKKLGKEFIETLPFELTSDQASIIERLMIEVDANKPSNALIQGDVGSGKTIIAITLAYLISKLGYQSVVLAPTTILAKQHFETFTKFLGKKAKCLLVTGTTKDDSDADILIGTTAVLARKEGLVTKPGLVVVDEQHKFGVKQREELLTEYRSLFKEKYYPHFINMTATPIPRTIVQSLFGDVDVYALNSKPKGRLPIKSFLVPDEKKASGYEWIKNEVANGAQVYWVCPLVEESDNLQLKAAKTTYEELKVYFDEFEVELIHGKLKEDKKTDIMNKFSTQKVQILVTTSVIEVGIDVPNASIIVIESAERFGLAQLHQMRGRVGRGEKQSWAFLYTSPEVSDLATDRLNFFCGSNDGLKIAEYDLSLRGPGEVYGVRQSGIPNLKIASFKDMSIIKDSQKTAEALYKKGYRNIELFS